MMKDSLRSKNSSTPLTSKNTRHDYKIEHIGQHNLQAIATAFYQSEYE